MKGRINALFLVVLSGCATADLSLKRDFKKDAVKNVAVVNFSTPRGMEAQTLGQIAADIFSQELSASGFSMVERSQIERVIGERQLKGAALVDAVSVQEIGKALGADVVVMGSILPALEGRRLVVPKAEPPRRPSGRRKKTEERLDARTLALDVSATMIRVETGEILWVARASANGASGVRSAVRVIIKRLNALLRGNVS